MSLRDVLHMDLRPRFVREWMGGRSLVQIFSPWAYLVGPPPMDLTVLYGRIDSIVRANRSLIDGLTMAATDAPRASVRYRTHQLVERLESGHSLADAMRMSPNFYPSGHADYIEAAERSGCLSTGIRQCMDETVEDSVSRQLAKSWVALYLFEVIAITGILLFFVIKVVPVFVEMVHDVGAVTPPPLAIMDRVSRGPFVAAPFLVPLVIALLPVFRLSCRILFRTASVQSIRSYLALPIPYFGTWHRRSQLGRMANIAARLLHAGATLPDALREASDADVSPPFSRAIRRIRHEVEQGVSLTEACRRQALIPPGFCAMVSLGETSGQLADALARLGEIYTIDVQTRGRLAKELMFPVFAIPLGVIVATSAVAVFATEATIADAIAGRF